MTYQSLILAPVLILAGCSHSTIQCESPTIPNELLKPCAPLLEIKKATTQDILKTLIENNRRYAECRIAHQALIEAQTVIKQN